MLADILALGVHRKHSAALMLAGMQGFRDMFSGSHPAKKFIRDMGLCLRLRS
jgi:2-octaprenylphenol hydroxylase